MNRKKILNSNRILRTLCDDFLAGKISAERFADDYMDNYRMMLTPEASSEGFNSPEMVSSMFLAADAYIPHEYRRYGKNDYYDYDDDELLRFVRVFLDAPNSEAGYYAAAKEGLMKGSRFERELSEEAQNTETGNPK